MEYSAECKNIWEKAHEHIVVGDTVKVFNKDQQYSTYYTFFKENRLKDMAHRYAYGVSIDDAKTYEVIEIGRQRKRPDIKVYVLKEISRGLTAPIFLMGRAGIIKIDKEVNT